MKKNSQKETLSPFPSPAEHSTPLSFGEGLGGEAVEGLGGEAVEGQGGEAVEDEIGKATPSSSTSYAYMTASPDRYELLKQFAKENRQNMTVAERYLWDHLLDYQHTYHFRRQHIIGDYIVDFVSLDIKLVIEVDGGYHAERQQMEDDARRTEDLNHMGFDVVRFTNEEVLFDTGKTLERLRKILGIE